MSYTNPINLSGLNGRNGFRVDGASAGDQSGFSVAAAGDVNGDGIADFLIGAYQADPNGTASGSTYLVFGRSDGFAASLNLSALNGTNGFRLDGVAADDQSGLSATAAGDVNGDGFGDLIIGASRADVNGGNSGAAYVVYGKSGGFAASLNLSALTGGNGFRLEGVSASDLAGLKVAAAGDVNGDGFADVIIGAQGADPNGSASGSSYVVFGRAGPFGASLNLSALNGTNGFRLDGVSTNALTGQAVASAGDVNGDGYDDLIIGSGGGSPNGVGAGAAYVVFGHSGSFSASVNLSALTGGNGFRLDGSTTSDQAGFAVSSAGDVNGDGFDDVIVGAIGVGATDAGASYVVFGHATGFAANLNLSALNGTNGFRLDGVAAQDNNGRAVAAAGDVNRDGFDDLIVGSAFADPNGQTDAGTSYVLFGKSGGFAASLSLSAINGTNGYQLDGVAPDDQSGRALAGVGDVNGDGFDDLLIGAARTDPSGQALAGSSYIYFGSGPRSVSLSNLNGGNGFRLDGVSSVPNFPGQLDTQSGDLSGSTVATAGDVNGDGFADLIIGAPNVDQAGRVNPGAAYVVFGSAGGFASAMSLSLLNGGNGFRLDGAAAGDRIGDAVASAGDVNGDGYADLIIGTKSAGAFGRSYVVFGGSGGFAAAMNLSALDGANGFLLEGSSSSRIGYSVASAGDVNGDGFADVIVAGSLGSASGGSAVVFGAAGGFAPTMSFASLNGTNGFRLFVATSAEFGDQIAVASAGDVNGDGFADLILGNNRSSDSSFAGRTYVVFGHSGGFGAALDLAALNGADGFRLDGGSGLDESGLSVAAAGDVNGDGFGDLLIGAPFTRANGSTFGSSYVVFGSSGGFASSLSLAALDGSNGFRLDGANGDVAGFSAAAAGDVNGDGFADLVIGAKGSAGGGGVTYVVYGHAGGFAASLSLAALGGVDGFRLDGVAPGDGSGGSVATAGDVDGDGFADLIVGAKAALDNAGATYVYLSTANGGALDRGTSLADTLRGTPDNDTIRGYGQNDKLFGNAGNDSIDGGAGNDSIDGGAGQDTGMLSGSQVGYRIGIRDGVVITSGADGLDRFTNVEALKWGAAAAVSIASLVADPGNTGLIFGKLGAAAAGYILPEAYSGPVAGLANQMLGSAGIDTVLGTERGDFINALAGDDAVDGGAGNDVLDGGLGSNFLTGGAGVDIFFVDGRGAASFNTWGTITDYTPGELVTIWGYQPGVSQFIWVASDGAPGFQGATMHWDLDGNGLIDTSVTFSGKTQAELPTPIYGSVAGQDYIFFG